MLRKLSPASWERFPVLVVQVGFDGISSGLIPQLLPTGLGVATAKKLLGVSNLHVTSTSHEFPVTPANESLFAQGRAAPVRPWAQFPRVHSLMHGLARTDLMITMQPFAKYQLWTHVKPMLVPLLLKV